MYPKGVPVIVAEKSNQTSVGNSYDGIKNVWPSLEGGKKRGVKLGSNTKADKIHEDWYLACEAYRKLASQDIKINSNSFINYSHFSACFTGAKSEEQYFGRFLVKFDNGQLEESVVQ